MKKDIPRIMHHRKKLLRLCVASLHAVSVSVDTIMCRDNSFYIEKGSQKRMCNREWIIRFICGICRDDSAEDFLLRNRIRRVPDHPLAAPAMMPLTKYFWNAQKIARAGMIDIIVPAKTMSQRAVN